MLFPLRVAIDASDKYKSHTRHRFFMGNSIKIHKNIRTKQQQKRNSSVRDIPKGNSFENQA